MSWRVMIEKEFPGAIPGPMFTQSVISYLDGERGFTPHNTVFGHSTCPDEINRKVTTFAEHYGENFILGGLAGFPFTGRTGFNAFSHHSPDVEEHQRLLILYGPHIGISEEGEIGKVKRAGMKSLTTACGSLIGAYNKLSDIWDKEKRIGIPLYDPHDQQQCRIEGIVAQYLPAIMESDKPLKTAVQKMYLSIDDDMLNIVNNSSFKGTVVLLGGIQINTPNGEDNYFQPLRFAIYHGMQENEKIEDCINILKQNEK